MIKNSLNILLNESSHFYPKPIKEIIKHEDELIALYQECYPDNDLINGNKLLIAYAVDLYVCKILQMTIVPNKDKVLASLKSYVDLQDERLKKDPFNIFSNPLYFLDNKTLKQIFNEQTIHEIRKYQKKVTCMAKDIANKYLKAENISETEFSFLVNFLNSNMSNDLKNIEGLVATTESILIKMINSNSPFNFPTKLLLLNFMNKKKEANSSIKSLLFVSDYTPDNNLWADNNEASSSLDFIFINRAFVGNHNFISPHILNLQTTFFHEYCHVIQYYNVIKNNISYQSFNALRENIFLEELLDKNNDNNDSLNYWASEVEINARYYAASQTLKFTKKYFPALYKIYKEQLKDKVTLQKHDAFAYDKVDELEGRIHLLKEKYNVAVLNTIIRKKPHYIEESSILNLFYYQSGSNKSLERLLYEESSLKASNNDIVHLYHDYITTYILAGDLDKFDITEGSSDVKDNLLLTLLRHYENTLKTIDFPLNHHTPSKFDIKYDENIIGGIISERFKALYLYEKFFLKHEALLNTAFKQKQQQLEPYRESVITKASLFMDIDYNNMKFEGDAK